jgi:hypothetical protein
MGITLGVKGGFIGQDNNNSVTDDYGVVTGGAYNQAGDDAGTTADRPYATVGGGRGNYATGIGSVVGGGGYDGTTSGYGGNLASGAASVIGGGLGNQASESYATVGGGNGNRADGAGAFVGGGGWDGAIQMGNGAIGNASVVGGGLGNSASKNYATVAGGYGNQAIGESTTVGGGYGNTAGSPTGGVCLRATVGGGFDNHATGSYATVSGGASNQAGGDLATVPGGFSNVAGADNSFAAGACANVDAAHHGAMVFSDDSDHWHPFKSAAADEFAVRGTGGFRLVNAIDSSGNPVASGTLIFKDSKLGVGTTAPAEKVDVAGNVKASGIIAGGVRISAAIKTANYTMTSTDFVILADASSAALKITLPSAPENPGMMVHIKKTDSTAHAVTISSSGTDMIQGGLTTVNLTTQFASRTLVASYPLSLQKPIGPPAPLPTWYIIAST